MERGTGAELLLFIPREVRYRFIFIRAYATLPAGGVCNPAYIVYT